jgi:heavy metal sensor kinase
MSTNTGLKEAPAMHAIMRRFHPVRLIQTPHLIRFRLTLWYTGLAALVLATFVGSVFYAFSHYQFDSIDNEAIDALNQSFNQQVQIQVTDPCTAGYGTSATNGYYSYGHPYSSCSTNIKYRISDPNALHTPFLEIQYISPTNGKPIPADNGKTLGKPASNSLLKDPTTKQTAQNEVKEVQRNPGATSIKSAPHVLLITKQLYKDGHPVITQIAFRLNRVEKQVDELKHILVYVAAVLLLISAMGGWMLSGRALKPVDEITRRARQITANDLSQRLGIKQEDELGRMAATFDDMIGRLEEAFERQKRFASDASHELRTPLAVMQSEVSLALARPRSSAEYRETLVSMDEEVSRLSTIVGDLLTLTRIDVDPAGIQHKPVDLDELLESLSARVGVIAAERDIMVRAERLEPVTVAGDPTRLRQLFTNLLDNAVNYTRDGGRVTVMVERTAEGARVRVADTGIGIAAPDLPRIFERFYRADGAREQNAQGTGLGLAISRSVVQAHHGHIDVVSEPGTGTTFTVVLPLDSRKPLRRVVLSRVPTLAR